MQVINYSKFNFSTKIKRVLYHYTSFYSLALRKILKFLKVFEDFAKYYTEHLKLFPEQVKILIADTAHSIAKSFSGTNKAELIILAKLALLLRD